MKKVIPAVVAGVILLPTLLVVLFFGDNGAAAACQLTPADANVSQLPTGGIAGYSGEQLQNAAQIMAAGAALGLDARGQTIGVMTAMGESSLRVLDQGDAVGPDSRGLFQQRDNGRWGSYEDRMDPFISATNFFTALQQVQGWKNLPPSIAAHRVQVNSDPYHYERYLQPAAEVVAGLSGVDPGEIQECTVPDGIIPGGINEPGPWGGYQNGRVPENTLSPIPWKPEYVLRADAAQAFTALNNAYRAQFGQDLVVNDGYRDYDEQVRAKEIYGDNAATPGQSNHGWALAVDVGIFSFYGLEYAWMDQNAPRFGWRNPDWARPGGRGPTESWHWEFWGVSA